jgi:uncharacterized membrane protein YgcG
MHAVAGPSALARLDKPTPRTASFRGEAAGHGSSEGSQVDGRAEPQLGGSDQHERRPRLSRLRGGNVSGNRALRPARGIALLAAFAAALASPLLLLAAGPPFPPPVEGQAVYDTAGVLRPGTIDSAEATIDAIEARVGAEIAVYTQLVPDGVTTEETEARAIALMDQWGIGRAGFDDGLVILFDLHENDPCHGQVQLYAGPGYRAAYLDNKERQQLFEDRMLPRLRTCDLDGALIVALAVIDQNATAEHAASLQQARQLDAILGLILAPLVILLLVGWAAMHWYRFGRDPDYLDSPSIHLPAPPRGLTPASGALLLDGRPSRRALTAALLDLASRGLLGFRETSSGLFGLGGSKLSIELDSEVAPDPAGERVRQRAERRPISPAEQHVRSRLASIAGKNQVVEPGELPKFGAHVAKFEELLEDYAVKQGWFTGRPQTAVNRWRGRGLLAFVAAAPVGFAAFDLPSAGLTMVAGALAVSGVALMVIAGAMPARTKEGAMVRTMLAAYRRTLEKTMAQARSMTQVAQEAAIPLVGTPDEAVVWGVALGLQDRVEEVLKRTADDLRDRRVEDAYIPAWYATGGTRSSGGSDGGGRGQLAPGLMAASALPNFGGMMAALSTVGNSPSSSSSSSGGGGFSGGSSGGGGGGSGGGF